MRKLFILMLSVISITIAAEQTQKMRLAIIYNDAASTKELIPLDEKPQITFTATDLVVTGIKDGKTYTKEFALSELDHFTYEPIGGMVTDLDELKENTDYVINANNISFYNVSKGDKLNVYAANGALVLSQTADDNGLNASTVSLPNGVYMLDLNGKTAKFVKK